MPEREDRIRNQLLSMSGLAFESFAIELLRRTDYPWLNPTSPMADLGSDARTETSELQHNLGERLSVAASKTDKLSKIRSDCETCCTKNPNIDVIVFVTPSEHTEKYFQTWKTKIFDEFGFELVVKHMEWLVPTASRPKHEDLVDQYLNVPPLGGDFINDIITKFSRETERGLRQVQLVISGMTEPLSRKEMVQVKQQLAQGKPVIVVGEAGVGKSGIAAMLAQDECLGSKAVLYLDSRRIAQVSNPSGLRHHFNLQGAVELAVQRVGAHLGCRLIIDQLDSIVGLSVSNVLIDLLLDCASLQGTEVVVLSRAREADEQKLLNKLTDSGFVRLSVNEIDSEQVEEVLRILSIESTPSLLELGGNLLNLDLLSQIWANERHCDWTDIANEVQLWERYLQVIQDKEDSLASEALAAAVEYAGHSLRDSGNQITIDIAPNQAVRRLVSWGMIVCIEGRIHQFKHEQLRDYLYAWNATEEGKMPQDIAADIDLFRTRSILVWMDKIYQHKDSSFRTQFIRGMFDV